MPEVLHALEDRFQRRMRMPCRPKRLSQPKQQESRQLCLPLDDSRNRPPAAPATPAILEALAELLLMAANKMAEGAQNDACKDHR